MTPTRSWTRLCPLTSLGMTMSATVRLHTQKWVHYLAWCCSPYLATCPTTPPSLATGSSPLVGRQCRRFGVVQRCDSFWGDNIYKYFYLEIKIKIQIVNRFLRLRQLGVTGYEGITFQIRYHWSCVTYILDS